MAYLKYYSNVGTVAEPVILRKKELVMTMQELESIMARLDDSLEDDVYFRYTELNTTKRDIENGVSL